MAASTSHAVPLVRSATTQAGRLLLPAAGLGLAADLLFRESELGLNFTLWIAALVCTWWVQRGGPAGGCSRTERALLVVVLLFGAGMSWRENEMLRVLDLLGIVVIFGLLPFAAASEGGAPPPVLSFGRLVALGGMMAWRGVRGPVPALLEERRAESGVRASGEGAPIRAVVRGLAIAAPLLLIFGALLGAADPSFGRFLQSLIRIDVEELLSHTFGVGIGTWIAAALISGVLLIERQRTVQPLPGVARTLGVIEIGVSLGLLDLLFGGYIAFQLPYFFGGAHTVLTREGLTFAEYARRGFGELVAVSALVLPLLLLLEPRVDRVARGGRTLFTWLAQVTLVLLVVIMGSALHRMSLYAGQFGLTADRFFATAFMTGIGVTALWFSVTVLRGASHRFLPGAIAAWIGWLGALHLINPERVIVQTNLRRAEATAKLDGKYLYSLSTDALPALLAGEVQLPPAERKRMRQLMAQQAERGAWDWRAWHYGRAKARRLLDRSGSPPSS